MRKYLAGQETYQAIGMNFTPTVTTTHHHLVLIGNEFYTYTHSYDNSSSFSINRNDLNNQDKQKYDRLKRMGLNDLAIAKILHIFIPDLPKNYKPNKDKRPSIKKSVTTPKTAFIQ